MRTIVVLPIKSFGAAKQRLSAALRGGSRSLLAQAMFADVLAGLRRVRGLDAIAVVAEDHEAEAVLRGDPVTVLRDQARSGQSAAALIGIEHARSAGFASALLVPGDTPLLDPAAVDALLDQSRAERLDVAIVPDRHRSGTNALLLTPPDALAPSFGPRSLERHLAAAREAGLSHRVMDEESLMHDVDTPEDLAALADVLERRRGVAPRTRGALRQFDRLHLRAPAPSPDEGHPDGEPVVVVPPDTWRPTREDASAEHRPAWA